MTSIDRVAREHRARIEAALQEVTSLDDDRILRRFVNLVEAMLRTNVYQHGEDGAPRPVIAFKFDCARVDELPLPLLRIHKFRAPRMRGTCSLTSLSRGEGSHACGRPHACCCADLPQIPS